MDVTRDFRIIQTVILCWRIIASLSFLGRNAKGEISTVDLIEGTAVPAAEALMGTVMMPVFPSSFPLEEFTDYGVQSQFMPSAPIRPRSDLPESRLGQISYTQNNRRRIESDSIMTGSVPVNTYQNPTTGIAQHQNIPHNRRTENLSYRESGPSMDSIWRKGGEGVLRSKGNYVGGGSSFGYISPTSIDHSDTVDYFDSPINYDDEQDKAEEGTLQAALYTLWEHRNEAYNNVDRSNMKSEDEMSSGYQEKAPSNTYFNPNHSYKSDLVSSHSITNDRRRPFTHYSNNHRQSSNRNQGFSTDRYRPSGYMGNTRNKQSHINHERRPATAGSGLSPGSQLTIKGRLPLPAHGGLRTRPGQGTTEGKRSGVVMGGGIRRIGGSLSGNFQNRRRPDPVRHNGYTRRPFQMVRPRYPVNRVGTVGTRANENHGHRTVSKSHESSDVNYVNYNTDDYMDFVEYPNYGSDHTVRYPSRVGTSSEEPLFIVGDSHQVVASDGSQFSSGDPLSVMLSDIKQGMISGSFQQSQPNLNNVNFGLNDAVDIAGLGVKQDFPITGLGDNTLQEEKSNWMSQVGEVMSGVSQQLPSIEKAVTTMSFLAFGIFMGNLLLQALANSTSLNSFLGREENNDDLNRLPFDFSDLPLDLDSLKLISDLWAESQHEDGQDDIGMAKQALEVVGKVYLSLHELARAGMNQLVSTLGVNVQGERTPPGGKELDPECLRLLLCEGHHITAPYLKNTPSYRFLPFWTVGVSWLSGDSNVPRLLEELRAEIAGQKGLACASVFPGCNDTSTVDKFLAKIRTEMSDYDLSRSTNESNVFAGRDLVLDTEGSSKVNGNTTDNIEITEFPSEENEENSQNHDITPVLTIALEIIEKFNHSNSTTDNVDVSDPDVIWGKAN